MPVDGSPLRLGEALELLHRDETGHDWRHVQGDGGTYLEHRTFARRRECCGRGCCDEDGEA